MTEELFGFVANMSAFDEYRDSEQHYDSFGGFVDDLSHFEGLFRMLIAVDCDEQVNGNQDNIESCVGALAVGVDDYRYYDRCSLSLMIDGIMLIW